MSSLPSEAEARKILADKRPGEKVKDSFLIRAIAALAPKGAVLRAYQNKSAWKPNMKKQK